MLNVDLSGQDLPEELLVPATTVIQLLNEDPPDWLPIGNLNVRFVDDKTIRELNRKYSGQDKATDVLSFSYIEDGHAAGNELGDIAISLETAERQAAEASNSLADELALLLLHAVLHIAGMDHAELAGQAAMDKLQSQILTAAGVKYRDFKWA
ncbi:MAG TPA: rRNA maturation RNase YbeY [Candidatus Nanoarchaeia archaeon]|nr:rRNA maturation RNase YbeY [Candidatus Nanoarchaeia archaeon]